MKRLLCWILGHADVELPPTVMNRWYECSRCKRMRVDYLAALERTIPDWRKRL